MANISAAMVKELRDRTGLGMMECKKALAESGGDVDKAIEDLRKSSGLKAAKKAGRTAADGVVVVRVADDNSYGVIVEVNSETDFVARDEGFLGFVSQVADKAFADKQTDVAALMAGDLESAREALVQKIGENITVRRIALVEGAVVAGYVHSNNRIACLVSLAGGDTEVARDVAMHVSAANPRVCKPEDMPQEELDREKEIIMAQPDMEGKPQEIKEKMAIGRVKKFLSENSLVEQAFVKNPETTVGKLIKDAGTDINGFTRLEVGEGIEVEKKDFAQEVAEQLQG
ncbi:MULTISPECIES: translation elongation factor Ts [unclassified Marinobacterium]|jgi:elongation factor Ts|uniref:translation elongation factor Ts n=1 Tax=unclassified Marinobacterium TaxID=2644139 RepID=UPI001569709F|nr:MULTISPECIES: translation elongation factor Ts [unclassified Marinobacterium]NRP10411.1 Elongation factor Ts [Marinobacterium sp. xm-g-48]NRP16186.1 Elongation factor Ts [Marinobacterium sp. xm-a-152]NRP28182.1 Elongation factor Ts [Marinobacterium sp. xm-d-420]NRP37284.1 Elongation factor Ts [Marinobacterium sp. xm-d-579]NRP38112.1 Elongation factor Ts [Marinobacterium sp. xm-a-121]